MGIMNAVPAPLEPIWTYGIPTLAASIVQLEPQHYGRAVTVLNTAQVG